MNQRALAHYAFVMDDSRAREYSPELPLAEFAFPGPLRDQLVDAILTGRKTSTTSLDHEHEISGEALPHRGQRFAVVDSRNRRVAIIEVTAVVVVALGEVNLAHVVDEGEGHATLAAWRTGHEAFWRSTAMFAPGSDATFTLDDATPVVLERFTLIERLT
jgi:uncharacterized protein YhfF